MATTKKENTMKNRTKSAELSTYDEIIIYLDEELAQRDLEEAEKRIYETALREKIMSQYSKEEWN